jgi:hypothetical protein
LPFTCRGRDRANRRTTQPLREDGAVVANCSDSFGQIRLDRFGRRQVRTTELGIAQIRRPG